MTLMSKVRKVGQLATSEQRKLVDDAVNAIVRPGWFRVKCPICVHIVGTPDRHGTLSIKGSTQGFRCFRCGVYGSLPGSTSGKPRKMEEDTRAPFHASRAPAWYVDSTSDDALESEACRPGIAYAESRGFDEAIRHAAGMGLAIQGRYADSLIVPHRDALGEWWGFTARKWYPKCSEPYTYPPGMSRSRMINDQCLQVDTEDPALMMEGSLDCMLYFPDVLGHMGKPITDHIEVIKKTRRPVVSVLDGDAWHVGQNFMYLLRMEGITAGAVRLPPGADPNQTDMVDPGAIRRAALESLTCDRAVVVPRR